MINIEDKLNKLASLSAPADAPTEQKKTKPPTADKQFNQGDADAWFSEWRDKYCPESFEKSVLSDGTIKYKLTEGCVFDRSHKDASVLIKADGTIGYNCFHDSCSGYSWKDFRVMFEPDAYTKTNAVITVDGTEIPFIKDKKGNVVNDLRNYVIALEYIPTIQGRIRFDDFSKRTMIYGSLPWTEDASNIRPWTDYDTHNASLLLCDYGLKNEKDLENAINIIAHKNSINPVIDYLESLEYKGDGYIRKLLPEYLGCVDSEYTFSVMFLLMTGIVQRIYYAGCKFDYVVTFVGAQGSLKSSFVRCLACDDAWFTDCIDSFSDRKKLGEQIQGKLIAEIPELSGFKKSDIESIKASISSTCDSYREAYGHYRSDYPRVTVFVGTTNEKTFLKDATGNRRFLIVPVDPSRRTKNLFSYKGRKEDFNNAWAEAVHYFKENTKDGNLLPLVLPESVQAEATERQELSNMYEEWNGIITTWLESNVEKGETQTCALDVWCNCLGKDKGSYTPKEAYRLNPILNALSGWEQKNGVRICRKTADGYEYFNYHGRGYRYIGNDLPSVGNNLPSGMVTSSGSLVNGIDRDDLSDNPFD